MVFSTHAHRLLVIVAFLINLIYNNDFVFNFPLRVGSWVECRAPDRGVWFTPCDWVSGSQRDPNWKMVVPLALHLHLRFMSSANISWDIMTSCSSQSDQMGYVGIPQAGLWKGNGGMCLALGQDHSTEIFVDSTVWWWPLPSDLPPAATSRWVNSEVKLKAVQPKDKSCDHWSLLYKDHHMSVVSVHWLTALWLSVFH